jgi:putative ABC transport system permease protein
VSKLPRAIIPLAWRNLVENKRKLLASVAGTAFAVTLMFMENGFRHAMLDSMVNVIERLDGQVVLVSRTLYTLSVPITFPYRRIVEARGVPDVVDTQPVYLSTRSGYWRDPRDGSLERICVIGVPLGAGVLRLPELAAAGERLAQPGTALADALSRVSRFGVFAPGQESELAGKRVRIVGTFRIGINSQSNGNLVTSDRNFLRYFPEQAGPTRGDDAVAVGVVRLRPGADVRKVRSALQAALPPDLRVLTLPEFIARERDFWDKVAPVGTVFLIGVVMGFIVGSVICYQVLFSDVSDRLGEFATLKAMGYSNFRLFRVVVMQGVYLAVLGYLAGLVVSFLLFRWVHEATGLPLDLSRNDPLTIFLLSLVMCVFAGAYAARKLLSVDPAQLFA